jgi:multiple sugar transport system ATP-binding protein
VEAMTMATRICVLSAGNIEQVGTPYELYNFPRNRFVATFIGSPRMNLLRVADGVLADFGRLGVAAEPAEIGIRPEHFTIGDGGALAADGTVSLVEYLGSEAFLHVAMPSGDILTVKASGRTEARIGDKVRIGFDTANAHYFDAAGQRLPLFDSA